MPNDQARKNSRSTAADSPGSWAADFSPDSPGSWAADYSLDSPGSWAADFSPDRADPFASNFGSSFSDTLQGPASLLPLQAMSQRNDGLMAFAGTRFWVRPPIRNTPSSESGLMTISNLLQGLPRMQGSPINDIRFIGDEGE